MLFRHQHDRTNQRRVVWRQWTEDPSMRDLYDCLSEATSCW